MDETSKSRKIWGDLERSVLQGKGIDIGCGPDPVAPDARRFDMEDGDANEITKFVHEQFDYVYASHCLEHMHDPRAAVLEWWKLVKPGGHLFFTVPDEDLYEKGIFPPINNPDHKATFTLSKTRSWSPVSVNVLDLARSLPDGELVRLALQDHGYNRHELKFAKGKPLWYRIGSRLNASMKFRTGIRFDQLEVGIRRRFSRDQTSRPNVLAQIQCIVRKLR